METYISENAILCSNVELGDMVWVHSANFDFEGIGYVQSLDEYDVTVRLELPDDHSAIQDTVADGWDPTDTDNIEIIDMIPFSQVESIRRLPPWEIKLEVWTRPLTSSERSARAKRQGTPRPLLPELDAHFQGRYQR